jgi:NMD protein affecting ribosome stability and mRNA decay
MVGLCNKCGDPIRNFKGYHPKIGEICFTCYLEMLQAPDGIKEKKVKATPRIT